MKKFQSFGILLVIFCFLYSPLLLSAQEPNEEIQQTIESILKNPEDGMSVTLRGSLIQELGSQNYLFKDDTGKINVRISDEVMLSDAKDPNNQLEIIGTLQAKPEQAPKVDVGFMKVRTQYFEEVTE